MIWQVDLWMQLSTHELWDEAYIILYAEMCGIGKSKDLNNIYDEFLLRLEE